MKVTDLIKELEALDQNLDVYISSDAEGNSFGEFTDLSVNEPERDEDGNYFDYEDEWGERPTNRPVVILWPN